MRNYQQTNPEGSNYIVLDKETGDKYKIVIWDATSGFDTAKVLDTGVSTINATYADPNVPFWYYSYYTVNLQMSYKPELQDTLFYYFGTFYDYKRFPRKNKTIEIHLSILEFTDSLQRLGAFSGQVYSGLVTAILPSGESVIINDVSIDYANSEIKLRAITKY